MNLKEIEMNHLFLLILLALPLTAQAVVIDNGVPIGNYYHWSVDVLTGGATESVVFTTRVYNNAPTFGSTLITESVVSSYRVFVDPGNDGQGFALQGSEPVRNSADNSVSSSGAFVGANGNTIHWEAVSRLGNASSLQPLLRTNYTFTVDANTPGPIGPLRVYQYLDGDIQDPDNDVFGTMMNAWNATIGIFDGIERFGVVQANGVSSFSDTATFVGLAADSFNHIQERIMGSGQPVAPANSGITHAEINLPLLNNFSLDFTHYGPGNIVSVLAWDINPDVDDAEISTALIGLDPLPVPLGQLLGVNPAKKFSCGISGCVVPVTCNFVVQCNAKVDLFVKARRFANAVADIPPGATVRVRPRLTNVGRSILRANRNKKVHGVMEIKNASTGDLFSSTRVRIRFK